MSKKEFSALSRARAIDAIDRRFKGSENWRARRVELCKLWIRAHCCRSGRRINYEMTASAIAWDVQRWINAVGAAGVYAIASDQVTTAMDELGYTAVSVDPAGPGKFAETYFNIRPRKRAS